MASSVEISELREEFNRRFTKSGHEALLHALNTRLAYPTDFRVSETPLFLSDEIVQELQNAGSEILRLLQSPEFLEYAKSAIPPGREAPHQSSHPQLLQIDFALALAPDGSCIPQLIELQGFPSLYCYQHFFGEVAREVYRFDTSLTSYFGGLDGPAYLRRLGEVLIGDSDPWETILLEIEPERQKTRIDFAATEKFLGIKAVGVHEVRKREKKLFYHKGNREIEIKRIYNRVVFDELEKKKPAMAFSFQDELDVVWIPHPNWYYRISKHTLPFLKSRYVPECRLLSEFDRIPEDLQSYVLKPLFSFAGGGVIVNPSPHDVKAIAQPEEWVLQKKVVYAPCIPTPDVPAKAEIRMMYVWDEKPELVTNLVRMSKGEMMGVDFNKNREWVGSSCAFFNR
jgi:hypothetical protein